MMFDAKRAGMGAGQPGVQSLAGLPAGERFQFVRDGSTWVSHGAGQYGTGPKGKDHPSYPALGPAVLVLVVGAAG